MSALQASYALPNEVQLRPRKAFSPQMLDRILLGCSIAIGLAQSWVSRYSMGPDGLSYLDLGDAFARRQGGHALNAYWSPLYAWTLGVPLNALKLAPRLEFPVVHAVNFGIFLLALFAFRFLLRAAIKFSRSYALQPLSDQKSALPEWTFVLFGYGIFLWASLDVVNIYDISPDLSVLACVCLATGLLLRLHMAPRTTRFALFGIVLGIAYWVKAPMFPLGVAFLVLSLLWQRSRRWRMGVAVSAAAFFCVAAPLVTLLSMQKGRFTFGDSARLNYCWFVSPATPWRNWHGEVPGSGTPVHPTRQLLQDPPVFAFDGPVSGTYPPWADPSYWNEGLRWHFKVRPQITALVVNVASELRLLLRAQPALLAGLLVLILLTGRSWLENARQLWPLFAIAATGFALYTPVHVEDRFVGGWLLVLFVTAFAAVRLGPSDQRTGMYVVAVIFALMALASIDQTVRYATNHLSIPGVGPISAWEDVVAAEKLHTVGLAAGDKIAFIGTGKGAYCAHLAGVRATAEVMAFAHGYENFWKLSRTDKQRVYSALTAAGVNAILTTCPEDMSGGWRQVQGTTYCALPLRRD